jgi:7,8-dihydropterin-6-yl-methyl-4-(beta-D-ribofuranosyl)aminobenzene 5'-phosphate synthase
MNPRNIGEIPDADGIGTIGSEECGDVLRVWIKVADGHLVDIKYKVFGCPAAIACCSMMSELAIGKHLDQAGQLTDGQVAEALGGLPAHKYHCSNLAASALHRAITSYIFKSAVKTNTGTITTLMDNVASGKLQSEHGLSLWVEYQGKRILFDTGQSDLVLKNAKELGVNLAETDAIVISHGHYDHTGGLSAVLDIAKNATLYIHPEALGPKFTQKGDNIRNIGMTLSTKERIHALDESKRVVWTEMPTEVLPGLLITSQIPRNTNFEDTTGAFFINHNCKKNDELIDDQALFFETQNGLVVLLGCAHSGVINTLDYVVKLTGQKCIYGAIGGMHLLNASAERIEYTIEAFRRYKVQKIGHAHCTGLKAAEKFNEAFADQCFVCSVGTRIYL